MENCNQDYSYDNCFWGKIDFLYKHSKLKYKEFINIGELSYNLAECINKFIKPVQQIKTEYKVSTDNYISSRCKGIQEFLDFIQLILQNLQEFSNVLLKIANKIGEKRYSYESKKNVKKMCEESLKKYESSLKSLHNKKNNYYDLINQEIELYLNHKLKKNKDINANDKNHIIENIAKKRKEYTEQLNKVENYRKEYIELQRNICNSEEEFERDCTGEIKDYFKQIISSYEELLMKCAVKKEVKECIDNMNGNQDNQIFAEKNRSIKTAPNRIVYCEYTENLEYYSNFEVVKNYYKKNTNEKMKEKQQKVCSEVKLFLNGIIQTTYNENALKFEEIVKDIVSNNLKEEDFIFLINQFQKSFDDYLRWKSEENVYFLEFKKVGEFWDNRFSNMQLYLDAFNKIRMNNKELDTRCFNYFIQTMKKILSFNDNEDIDYKLCELLITLSETFFTTIKKDGKEIKVYASEIIKDTPLLQKSGFWIGIIKNEINEEIMKEIPKKQILSKNRSFHAKFNKKNKENNIEEEKADKNVIAKLMSISYNLIQFVMDSETLNNILVTIFRCFKIDNSHKEIIISMINSNIESEGISHLKLNEEMLFNCDNFEYYINLKEKRKALNYNNNIIIDKENIISGEEDPKINNINNNDISLLNNGKNVYYLNEAKFNNIIADKD